MTSMSLLPDWQAKATAHIEKMGRPHRLDTCEQACEQRASGEAVALVVEVEVASHVKVGSESESPSKIEEGRCCSESASTATCDSEPTVRLDLCGTPWQRRRGGGGLARHSIIGEMGRPR